MKEYETALYEEFCKQCKSLKHCPWLNISGDTCFDMTAFEKDKKGYGEKIEYDNGEPLLPF